MTTPGVSPRSATDTSEDTPLGAAVNERVASLRGKQAATFLDLLAMAAERSDVISLGRGEPDVPTPTHIAKAAIEAIEAGHTTYTHPAGLLALREAIGRRLEHDNGLRYDPGSEIVVTTGAQEAMAVIFQTLLDPGDEVLLATPHYLAYEENIRVAGGVPVFVSTRESDDFEMRVEEVEPLITDKTKILVLISPANPTAGVLTRGTLERMAHLAIRHDLIVLSDELYDKVVYEGFEPVSIATMPGMRERTIVVNGFSKTYSMTGFRVGYMAAPAEFCRDATVVRHAFTISTPTPSQYAAIAALDGPQDHIDQMLQVYTERRETMRRFFDRIGVTYGVPRGGFYFFANISKAGLGSFEFCARAVRDHRVLFFPGTMFGATGEGYVRISFLAPKDQLNEALSRFEALWASTRAQA